MSISAHLIADFEREVVLTRRMLEAVPEEHFGWKPHEKSMTLGQLAGHIAENASWMDSMLDDAFDFATVDYQPYVPKTAEQLMAEFEKHSAAMPGLFEGRDDDFMRQTWVMKNGPITLIEQPRHEVVREMGIHHLAHHRGQLSVYLRLLDVKVPGIYGPTADDKEG